MARLCNRGPFRWLLWVIGPGVVASVAYANRGALAMAVRLMREAALWWLVPAILAIGGVYLCRAAVYSVALTVLGYSFTRPFLWSTALIATSLHQLVPAGGASGYAFLTFALHRWGVPGGQASLIALIDTLSYAVAVATLLLAGLVYPLTGGVRGAGDLPLALAPGILAVTLAAYVYFLQRDPRRFTGLAIALKNRLAAVVGRRWADAPIRNFFDEYYAGKAVIQSHPGAFYRMVGFQYLAVGCDAAALYVAFLALGQSPPVWVVFMGFVVAMATLAIVSVPGGGGSFEAVMSVFFTRYGVEPATAIAAAILYRLVAFWIPVVVSLFMLLQLRRPTRDVRASERSPQRRGAGSA
ncbi:MAG: hypothetical protein DMD82_05445 [Candidatus Rokuibacteriota bacterium]|nr:MAG: hypothetical protein DMD82_05445 [Candidatus Rokubacteria bacterium]